MSLDGSIVSTTTLSLTEFVVALRCPFLLIPSLSWEEMETSMTPGFTSGLLKQERRLQSSTRMQSLTQITLTLA